MVRGPSQIAGTKAEQIAKALVEAATAFPSKGLARADGIDAILAIRGTSSFEAVSVLLAVPFGKRRVLQLLEPGPSFRDPPGQGSRR